MQELKVRKGLPASAGMIFKHLRLINRNSLLRIVITIILTQFVLHLRLGAQTVIVADSPHIAGTTVVIPGKHFKRSGLHKTFFGSHYREEWLKAVRVQNLLLDTVDGGLTAFRKSGGRQTRGLRLKNSEGKEYQLRSVDKDFSQALGEIFQGTFVSNIAKDQASLGHPYAPIMILPMIRATKIFHPRPRLYFVPKQPALGEFSDSYGDQLYTLEERPDENQEDAPYFGNSKNVIGTDKLFEKIFEDNDNRVNQEEFARARLFDMFIGDWSRHKDQWRWAEFSDGDKTIYRAIPRDRDQAFTTFDGFFPWVASSIVGARHLESFDSDLSNVKDFNEPARMLDMLFLSELKQEQWIQLAKELQSSLTDSVIEYGVRQMPAEAFDVSGELIISKLKNRRNELQQYAKEYYEYLAQRVDLAGTQGRELFEIDRYNKDSTRISIYKISKDNEVSNSPYYSRVFSKKETKEVRLYGLGGVDSFVVKNAGNHGIRVRIIDPEGTDYLGMKRSGNTKISRGTRFEYDTAHEKKFDFFFLPFLSPSELDVFAEDPLGRFTRAGLRITANARLFPKPWQKEEYETWHLLSANYGFLRGTFFLAYVGTFRHVIGKWDVNLNARYDAPAVENFYGTGNESVNTKLPSSHYQTKSNRIFGSAGLSRRLGRHHGFGFEMFYQHVKVRETDVPFNGLAIDPAIFSSQQFAGLKAGYNLRLVNDQVLPTKGIDLIAAAGYFKNITRSDREFIKVASSLSVYIPLSRQFNLALRAGGGIIDGEADYYHQHSLGGNETIRGYPRERFYGDKIFYNNNEIRWLTNTRNIIFNGKIGLLAFYDTGRVWQPGEDSDTWHAGYGAGLILVPFNKIILAGTYGKSREGYDLLLRASLFF